jgi:uncharacterized protein (TIGR03000 family)
MVTYSPYHVMPPADKKDAEKLPAPMEDKKKKEGDGNVRATLLVELPADATFYIDGQPMKTTSGKRTFVTPTLQTGQVYYYELRAEIVRDGQTRRASTRVVFRPGDEIRATFNELDSTATVTVRAAGR